MIRRYRTISAVKKPGQGMASKHFVVIEKSEKCFKEMAKCRACKARFVVDRTRQNSKYYCKACHKKYG
ncbi:hypothetical protein J4460_05025 [Candidatus Woesearchaeota archaeon]|nr:hypothetical protein [Candidatus Woesearchaeota archaeon]HIH38050.1 hypothetical protein [Candidatus Woesearchaeota archaeon]HIH48569.1 hypothetical protein [Candidatus Woesearchaeota archaeon]HIJ04250.1 hypothetical protein [Candidatus Woesearchaeota archaeon]